MIIYNVLITGTGGGGVGEGIYKSLEPLKKYNVFSCNNSYNSACIFDLTEISFLVPSANHKDYINIILDICRKNEIQVIIPGSELELVVLVKNRDIFTNYGIVILANTFEVISIFDNKWETHLKLKEVGVQTPDTTLDIDDTKFFERNSFPMIIKPVTGYASKNIFIVESDIELRCVVEYMELKNIIFVIQEYVGTADEEFTVSVLSDFSGNYLGSIVLKRVLTSGFSQYIECDDFEEIDLISQKIALKINSKGPLNIQCRLKDGILYVFEINPRFSGSAPFRTLLGFNEADVLLTKIFENMNIFNKNIIKIGSFGVRSFRENVYNINLKYEIKDFR